MVERIALIGLSGSGKSAVAPLVAARLGWMALDTDDLVVRRFGMPIAEIFARFGEPVFRAAEREALLEALRNERVVVATGGGIVLDERNWVALRSDTAVVHLTARLETLASRLRAQVSGENGAVRPLLAGALEERLRSLWEQRRNLYRRADVTVETDDRTLDAVADEIVRAVRSLSERGFVPFLSLAGGSGRSDLFVRSGLLEAVGELVRRRWPNVRRAFVITDDHVERLWGEPVRRALERAAFQVTTLTIPAGEQSKNLGVVERLLDQLLESGIERSDVVVALGGGVVGDIAGFVSSIVLRGVGLVQVPTSLLAMVDASVGGKTGVDHRLGKNLIGTFYQPHLVIADPVVLSTLPEAERRSGWAEVVKHAMIECTATDSTEPSLLPLLMSRAFSAWWEAGALDEVVRRNIAIKAAVVAADERESGLRRILNYGHTLGHAVEAASDYRLRHGEAVAIGMRAVARLAQRLGACSAEVVRLQDELLDAAGLPRSIDLPIEAVLERLRYDKKVEGGVPTWILPTRPGRVVIRRDVPLDAVRDVARSVLAPHSEVGGPLPRRRMP
ncbi:3-dehydroquinate synthase [Thermomicrobium sp. 4228-Ro]|uniref:3-dehydroquinate synthase n=1 Tax=Thermomicrobium sp. 4228-Ro TaxID=2993937 RepID=UPI0022493153|nr:3-dehydroquinate synthase [Thermomicrobium sp. 4228-Ro]MCX2725951.1 3-dehydroquinate synthase [Thermomicrobium sp. 4228-Ro]